MSGGDPSGVLRDIGTLFSNGMLGGLTDRQLLERFVNRTDSSAEDAFTILLERHGPMVWGVCRRLLPDRDAAADAFQATFLVLVRRATGGQGRRLAGAVALRRQPPRRRTGAGHLPAPEGARPAGSKRWPARPLIRTVPSGLRSWMKRSAASPSVNARRSYFATWRVCLTRRRRRLGCPVGTVESRLSRGRQRLRDRLVRRGLAPAAAAVWAEMAREASAAMPAALIKHTARFVTSSPAAGAVPVAVTALAEGVIQMMWLARLKPLVAVAAALILATAGVAVLGRQTARARGGAGTGQDRSSPDSRRGRRRRAGHGGQPGPCQAAARPDRRSLGHAASVGPKCQNRYRRPVFLPVGTP